MTSNTGTQGGAATGGETSGHRDEVGLGLDIGTEQEEVDTGTPGFAGNGTSDEGETASVIYTAKRGVAGKPKVVRMETQSTRQSGVSSSVLS